MTTAKVIVVDNGGLLTLFLECIPGYNLLVGVSDSAGIPPLSRPIRSCLGVMVISSLAWFTPKATKANTNLSAACNKYCAKIELIKFEN